MTVNYYTQIIGIFISVPSLFSLIEKLIKNGYGINEEKSKILEIIKNYNEIIKQKEEYYDCDLDDDIKLINKSSVLKEYFEKEHKFIDKKCIEKLKFTLLPHSYFEAKYDNYNYVIIGFEFQKLYDNHKIEKEIDIDLIDYYKSQFKLIFNRDFDLENIKVKLYSVPDDCCCCS